MPRLSIVIPSQGSIDALESSLVSVLQHRPETAEVLVVLNRPYEDPYHLNGEVRFVQAEPCAGFVACVNLGLRHVQGDVVHLLASGVEATEGWADEPLARFDDPNVAAVAPLVLDARDHGNVLSAGLDYDLGGQPLRQPEAHHAGASPGGHRRVRGACGTAAFYRQSVLEALGGLDAGVGDMLADVDLALALEALGFVALLEPQSVVYSDEAGKRPAVGFRQAWFAERLFLRHVPLTGWRRSLFRHALTVSGEFARSAPRPVSAVQLMGRLAAWGEWLRHSRYRRRLFRLRDHLRAGRAVPRLGLRMDSAHGPGHAAAVPVVDPRTLRAG